MTKADLTYDPDLIRESSAPRCGTRCRRITCSPSCPIDSLNLTAIYAAYREGDFREPCLAALAGVFAQVLPVAQTLAGYQWSHCREAEAAPGRVPRSMGYRAHQHRSSPLALSACHHSLGVPPCFPALEAAWEYATVPPTGPAGSAGSLRTRDHCPPAGSTIIPTHCTRPSRRG